MHLVDVSTARGTLKWGDVFWRQGIDHFGLIGERRSFRFHGSLDLEELSLVVARPG